MSESPTPYTATALDLTKPVQMCDGRKARIICTDSRVEKYPVVALVTSLDGSEERVYLFQHDGRAIINNRFGAESALALINVPPAPVGPRDFKEELAALLNRYSCENSSDTPDFILAEHLVDCFNAFMRTTNKRDLWHKENPT